MSNSPAPNEATHPDHAPPPSPVVYRFANFHLDVRERRLLRDGAAVPLSPRAFDVLVVLIEHPGALQRKEDLLLRVWRDTVVEEANLTVAISAIRKAIGASLIETVPKHGYRFTGAVEPVRPAEAPRARVTQVPRGLHGRSVWLIAASFGVVTVIGGWGVRTLRGGPAHGEGRFQPVAAEKRLTSHPADDSHPAWSRRGRVVFSSDRDGDMEIYSADTDGANLQRLTTSPGLDRDPAWSPDGAWIAFASERGGDGLQIYVMNIDGSAVRRVTALALSCTMPAWAPDGRALAFQHRDAAELGEDIYTMGIDGSHLVRVTTDRAPDVSPDWSPDGTTIAFASRRPDVSADFDVYAVSANGGLERRLTSDWAFDGQPAWSPDGTEIAFTSERDGGEPEVYLMNADGTGQRRFTVGSGSAPAWAPDGHELVFGTIREGNPEIFRASIEASVNLTHSPARDTLASWSPDGRSLAFTSNRDGKLALYLMDMASGQTRKLTDGTANDSFPSWASDGRRLVFQSDRAQAGWLDLYILDTVTRAVTRLTSGSGTKKAPAWSPDGGEIAFMTNAGRHPSHFQLFTIGPDGAGLRQVHRSASLDADPAWSPDASRIAFASDRFGNLDVFTIAADGSDLRRLTSAPSNEESAEWSPDGTRIAYASNRGRRSDEHDIYVMSADGSNPMRVSTRMGQWPRWRRSGDSVVFPSRRAGNEELILLRLPPAVRSAPRNKRRP